MSRALVVLTARSVGAEALERLRASRAGSVHSSYSGAVNLATSRGLVCVVGRSTGRGPLNVVADGLPWTDLRPGADVGLNDGSIRLGPTLEILSSSAEVYDPPLKFGRKTASAEHVLANSRTAREAVAGAGRFSGLGGLLFTGEALNPAMEQNPYCVRAAPGATALLRAVEGRNPGLAKEASMALAGLGVGLTPSADDLMAGALLSLALGGHNGLWEEDDEVINAVLEGAAGRTSRLSYEFMSQAARGRANERAVAAFGALCTGRATEVTSAFLELVRMGESSGTDLSTGLILGTLASLGPGRN